MSKFFRSAGSDSSESSSSDSEDPSENDSLRPKQRVEESDLSGISLGNNAVGRSAVQGFDNKDLMAHALLEDRCLDDVRKEFAETPATDQAILRAAVQRYKTVSARLIGVGLLAPGLDADVHAQARKQFRQGLDLLSQGSNSRKGSAEVQAPSRRLLTGAGVGFEDSLNFHELDLQLAHLPIPSALDHLMSHSNVIGNSRYRQDFEELGILGKGGYGVVYSCRHKLDGVTYAVKKVPLSPSRREKIIAHGQSEIDALLSEVRTLAQLDHPNIVRYFNGWIDWINIDGPTFASSDEVQLGAEDTRFSDGISFGRVITESDNDHHIAFENSLSRASIASTVTDTHSSVANESKKLLHRTSSHGTHATVSEEDIESIPRNNFSEPSESIATDTDGIKLDNAGPQLALHMQMALYPMTLTSFLATDTAPGDAFGDVMPMKHCFHLQPSVRIVLAILEGVDYLHRHDMVHRDLKPGNVFMAPCHDSRSDGSIDLFSCDGCWIGADTDDAVCEAERTTIEQIEESSKTLSLANKPQSVPLAPQTVPQARTHSPSKGAIRVRIGDFGLVAALAQADHEGSASSSQSPVGTELYRAPSVSNTSPALDIYALGIIAFELLWPFGTRMERHSTIHALRDGRFPAAFSKNFGGEGGMEECIEIMLSGQAGIGEIRDKLLGMLQHG